LKAFKATGVEPRDADVILKRFKTTTLELDEDTQTREYSDGDSWNALRELFNAAVKDKAKVEAK
jgi:hypothetical protein